MPPKFRMPIAKASRKDPQQFRLYRMEQECFMGLDRAELTLKQIERFTRAVARACYNQYAHLQETHGG